MKKKLTWMNIHSIHFVHSYIHSCTDSRHPTFVPVGTVLLYINIPL